MTWRILTIFPDYFDSIFRHGVVGKAVKSGQIRLAVYDLRDWGEGPHRSVDDRPLGGGEGMLMRCEPLFEAVEAIWPGHYKHASNRVPGRRIILLSAQGPLFTQTKARELLQLDELLFICGRYEGVDERVADHLADEELSVGDYVLSGGELPAAIVMDAVGRLIPGVVGNEASTVHESFRLDEVSGRPVLDCPQYTQPASFRGWDVPAVLTSGNHAEIRKWRRQAALEKTARHRPDLIQESPRK